ncbi:DUF3685 domain-containing protein [Neosynechococcus sphagnicola]|uniref:DUF3685 domain-containing protein n=1 Tax=Neosynechococcus sphagnicola TaxID=1501145 RepID=UPI00068C01BC|nr:DUF3685 domain-containing protein [Neosynechococcus sphagnicola]
MTTQVFRLGFGMWVEGLSQWQMVVACELATASITTVMQPSDAVSATGLALDLVILDLATPEGQRAAIDHRFPSASPGLTLLTQLKTQYPQLPVLLLTTVQESSLLLSALAAGANGYCPKGIPNSELLAAMEHLVTGKAVWPADLWTEAPGTLAATQKSAGSRRLGPGARLRQNLRQAGIQRIDTTLAALSVYLQNPSLSAVDGWIMTGRQRELRAARWLVNHLLATSNPSAELAISPRHAARFAPVSTQRQLDSPPAVSPASSLSESVLRSQLFEAVVEQLQGGLRNLTERPLEIDILREDKKQELLYITLRQLETLLDELRFSQVLPLQLREKIPLVLQDLWQGTTMDFFGKYSTLLLGAEPVAVIPVLLGDAPLVQAAILNKIPLVEPLLAYLLFQTGLTIDNEISPVGSEKARERATLLLQNLLLQVANAVVHPLLNHFADVESMKQGFYDRRLISTREIARFRNNLSWKYRLGSYIGEPKAIFESRFELLVLDQGIHCRSIYAPRTQELTQLAGLPMVVTLILEARDAIAPRLRSALSFLGSGVVYVLTEVVGRGIGLIGRGIVQGIGSAWQENRYSRDRQK